MYQLSAIGCDPEYALMYENDYVPVNDLIGGTKDNPVEVEGGSWQEDCVAAEIGITPSSTIDDFVSNIKLVTDQLSDYLTRYDIRLAVVSSVTFPENVLLSPEAWKFGCLPDYNAYNMKQNRPPQAKGTLRTFGGHVHVSWEGADPDEHRTFIRKLVLFMDLYLGVPSVLYDKDTLRRSMYGSAGSFRFKPYGMEYRSLSNFWLRSESLQKWVYRNTEFAFAAAQAGTNISEDLAIIQDCINNSDVGAADHLIAKYGIPLPEEE